MMLYNISHENCWDKELLNLLGPESMMPGRSLPQWGLLYETSYLPTVCQEHPHHRRQPGFHDPAGAVWAVLLEPRIGKEHLQWHWLLHAHAHRRTGLTQSNLVTTIASAPEVEGREYALEGSVCGGRPHPVAS